MFTAIKTFFGGWVAKIMAALLIAAVLLAWYFKGEYERKTEALTKSQAEVTRLDGEVKQTRKEFETFKASQGITDATDKDNRVEKKELDTKSTNVAQSVTKKVREIEQKYDPLPKTPETNQAKADEISTARLGGVWTIFCAGVPSHPNCVPKADAAASAAAK